MRFFWYMYHPTGCRKCGERCIRKALRRKSKRVKAIWRKAIRRKFIRPKAIRRQTVKITAHDTVALIRADGSAADIYRYARTHM